MKTIEEKAKRFDEALNRCREFYETLGNAKLKEEVEVIFPELKESEDERMKKGLISHLKELKERAVEGSFLKHPTHYDAWLAWLEKQDSYYTFEIEKGHWYKCVCDYMLNGSDLIFKHDRLYYCRRDWRLIGEIDERNVKDMGVNGYKSFFRPATNQEIKDWLEKQCEQKPTWSEKLSPSYTGSLVKGRWKH